jgi:copper chaperone CopZ
MLSIGFPSYSHYLLPAQEVHAAADGDFNTVKLDVIGMTCTGCEVHVNTASSEVDGVKSSSSDYENESAVIVFDPTITNVEQISDHIEKETGYSVRKAKK